MLVSMLAGTVVLRNDDDAYPTTSALRPKLKNLVKLPY